MNTKAMQAYGVLFFFACPLAQAMNFNIPTSSSIESAQIGGASLAFPQSAVIASENPAGMSELGNRIDGGLQLFFGSFRSSFGNENNRDDFKVRAPIPSGGINYQLDDRTALGLSVYSIGSGSDYSHAAVPGMGFPTVKTKIFYVNFAPTLAYKVTPDLSLGLSALIGVQQVQARGLVVPQADGSLGVSPPHGIATSTGLGWRVGALWKADSRFSLGAGMNNQDVWRVGMSWNASQAWTLRAGFKHATAAVDAQHTNANYFSPGVLNDSVSAGFTYHLSPTTDLSLGYEFEFPETLRGKGPSTGTNIGAHYSSVLLGLGMRY